MSVGILLITHNNVGQVLLDTALVNIGRKEFNLKVVAIPFDCDPDKSASDCRALLAELDQGDGILVLTDLYGSTPSNIAHQLNKNSNVKVVAGLNLPMLMRVMNYPQLELSQLVEKAISGGKEGIVSAA
jgi:PTS system ascorbate-specific IIA component